MSEDNENIVNNNESEVKQTTNNNGVNANNTNDKKGFAIAALVLGILAIVLCCIWYVSIICGILALIFGIIGRKSSKKGMSIAGIVTGVIGIIITIVLYVGIVLLGLGIYNSALDSIDTLDDYSSSFDYDYDYDY